MLGGLLHGLGHGRVLGAIRDDVEERVEQERHIEGEVGNQLSGDGWVPREVIRPEQPRSSPVTPRNTTERRGASGSVVNARATSIMIATPDASSWAPL